MTVSTEGSLPGAFVTGRLDGPMARPVSVIILGAGGRGGPYAELIAQRPDVARVVAVAEQRDGVRAAFAERHGLAPEHCFRDWHDVLERPRLADVAVIALLDHQHLEAATKLSEIGYQLILEKPMATTEADCQLIAETAKRNGTALAIAHVMRYTPYTKALKDLIARGAIGDIMSVEHLEPVGFYHFAHSFVRGNWRNEEESTFLLMSKSCHDVDWIMDVVGKPVTRVSSFGSLRHFRPESAPAGSTDRCITCPVEKSCAYSAKRLYNEGLRQTEGSKRYFVNVMTSGVLTQDAVDTALAEGPYGRCVYRSDNDVVDHQVVNLEFDGGATASFTLTAFTPVENRRTKVFGSQGQITGDGRYIECYDFLTEQTTVIDTSLDGASAAEGHAGGDAGMINAFLDALHQGRPELIVSGIDASLASHRVVFSAEQSRRTGRVVELPR